MKTKVLTAIYMLLFVAVSYLAVNATCYVKTGGEPITKVEVDRVQLSNADVKAKIVNPNYDQEYYKKVTVERTYQHKLFAFPTTTEKEISTGYFIDN